MGSSFFPGVSYDLLLRDLEAHFATPAKSNLRHSAIARIGGPKPDELELKKQEINWLGPLLD